MAARRVVSSADATVTLLGLVGERDLSPEVVEAVRAIDYSSASLKMNLALSELPSFTALPGHAAGPQHRGTIHVCPGLEYIERAFDDARAGRPSASPVLECTIPSVVDPSVAPPGRHLMQIFVQYAPYRLAEGTWDERKEAFGDRCVDLLEEVAPGFRRSVLHREVLSPLDIERRFGLTGGNIFQGAMGLSQLSFMRPIPGYAELPDAGARPVDVRRGHPPWRRRHGGLRLQRGAGDPARRAAGVGGDVSRRAPRRAPAGPAAP